MLILVRLNQLQIMDQKLPWYWHINTYLEQFVFSKLWEDIVTRENFETPWDDFKIEIENTIMPNLEITH